MSEADPLLGEPRVDAASLRAPRWIRLLLWVSATALGAYVVQAASGLGGAGLQHFLADWVWNGVFFVSASICVARALLVRQERWAWLAMGAGLALFVAGWVYYQLVLSKLASPPFPSLADALWLPFYPLCYAGFVLLLRSRMQLVARELWLDGLIGALALAAVAAAFVFGPLLAATDASISAVVTNLTYSIADLHMVAFLLGVMAASGWRAGRGWTLMAAGFLAATVGDIAFAYEVPAGTFELGGVIDAAWPLAALAVAFAAWQPPVAMKPAGFQGSALLVVPAAFAGLAIALHLYDIVADLNSVATGLATITLVAAAMRTYGAYREMRRLERLANLDPLTRIPNRRAFHARLDTELAVAAEGDRRLSVVAFDVDGFKDVNDLRGHAEGDRILREVGRVLAEGRRKPDAVARTGGDEFALILPGTTAADASAVAQRLVRAVSRLKEGIGLSFGVAEWPADGPSKELLLLRADVALYLAKSELPAGPAQDPSAAPMRVGDADAAAARQRRARATVSPERELETAQLRAYAEDVRKSYTLGLERAEALQVSYLATVTALAAAVEAKDDTTGGHIQRVHRLGLLVARALLPGEATDPQMAYGFLLHDIGKLSVPDAVLTKPGKLTAEEWELMRGHPEAGARILSHIPFLTRALDVVLHHHERWDGNGYPTGLAGEEIPIWARIFAVVDAVDAMTSDRPYRRALSLTVAFEELETGSGSHFDPACVEAFRALDPREVEQLLEHHSAAGADDGHAVPFEATIVATTMVEARRA